MTKKDICIWNSQRRKHFSPLQGWSLTIATSAAAQVSWMTHHTPLVILVVERLAPTAKVGCFK
jgi:hypothetical protein